MTERRYRGEPSRPIPVWNGVLEHLDRMGMAIWLYLWCLDKITREQDGVGYVLGGSPVKVEQIVRELGRSDRAARRDLKTLRDKYLRLRWTPYGYVIHVLNSRKFGIWKPLDSLAKNGKADGRNGEADGKSGEVKTENGRSKEDSAVAAVDAAAKQPPRFTSEETVWGFLGVGPCGPASFRSLLEAGWRSRNGEPRSALIGNAVDAWEVAEGGKLPAPALFRALSDLRSVESHKPNPGPLIRIPTASDIRPKER